MSLPSPVSDAAAVLTAAGEAVLRRRLDEVDELQILAQWAALHSGDVVQGARRALVELGGEGTPKVPEHCLGEIALARATTTTATSNAMADVLDLQHRLPQIWAAICTGVADLWIARKVARMSRQVPLATVWMVDQAVARMLGHQGGGRILTVAEAKIIEADIDAHNQRVEEEKRRRYVGFGRTNEYGLRTLIAQLEAADAAWIDATIARVVEILAAKHQEGAGETITVDQLRAMALGLMARPAELLALLAENCTEADGGDTEAPPLNRAIAFPADLLDRLRQIDWSKLAPKAVLYLHLHESALVGRIPGVVRVEGSDFAPMTLDQLHGLLVGAKVAVKPVIDLNERVCSTAYEHPESLKERVYLNTGGEYWPYSGSTSRNVDYDHVIPYAKPPPGSPPTPQTGTHNSGPLARRHHRWKTHAGYQARQLEPGRYLWITPHGLAFIVDHNGTRSIPLTEARRLIRPRVDFMWAS